MVLGPSMTYTCALFPTEDATLEEAQHAKYDLVARKLDLQPGQRLLDVGCGWGGMVRHAAREYGVRALGVTLSREQAEWAQAQDQGGGARPPRRGPPPRLPRRPRDRLRRGQLDRPDRAHRRRQLPVVLRLPARQAACPDGRLLNHCITRPDNKPTQTGAFIDRYVFPDGELTGSGQDHHRDPGRRPRGAARGEPARPLRQDAGRLVRATWRRTGTSASPRSARARPGSGASTWPGRGWASSATRSSCTRCWRRAPTTRASAASRCGPPG